MSTIPQSEPPAESPTTLPATPQPQLAGGNQKHGNAQISIAVGTNLTPTP